MAKLPFRLPESFPWKRIPQLDGGPLDAVKIAAAVCMVIDHGNDVLLDSAYPVCFMIGRGAFPLFCYALAMAIVKAGANGARYAVTRHCPRIFLTALLVEPIYAPVMTSPPVNVLFTLALGAACAGVSLRLRDGPFFLGGCLALAAIFLPPLSDFGWTGVAIPALIIGVMQGRKGALPLLLCGLGIVNLGLFMTHSIPFPEGMEGYALLGMTAAATILMPWLPLQWARKMKPGPRRLPKYALYIFYPAHLALLFFARFAWEMTSLGAWHTLWDKT